MKNLVTRNAPSLPTRHTVSFPTRHTASFPTRHPVLHAIWLGLSGGALALALALGVLLVLLPKGEHAVALTVNTGSMAPALPAGTLVVDRLVDPQQVRLGDVITYLDREQHPITHRVVGVVSGPDGLAFRTKGDSNAVPDPIVKAEQVRARVWYSVPGLGWANSVVNTKAHPVFLYAAVAPLFGYAGYEFYRGLRARQAHAALTPSQPA